MIPAVDAHVFRRLLAGHELNGEAPLLSPEWQPLAEVLAPLVPDERRLAWQGALAIRSDREEIRQAVLAQDPDGPIPDPQDDAEEDFASPADVRRHGSTLRWRWEGWIPDSSVFGVAAGEGVGKTRFLLDLNRRIWLGEPWPDGQPATYEPGTPCLWLCADGHHAEIAAALPELGLPDEALLFTGRRSNPYGNTDLDEPETLAAVDRAMAKRRPALVFVDTLTYATTSDLCDARTIATLKGPLVDLCQGHRVPIGLSLHLSKEGQALGRRVKGVTRTLIHLECPDPDRPGRLRLWVEKSYATKPPALGVTIGAAGNTYDFSPPARPDGSSRGGRPPEKLDKAIAFLVDHLSARDRKGVELITEWEAAGENKGTLFNARTRLMNEGRIVIDDSKKPQIWHLADCDPPRSKTSS